MGRWLLTVDQILSFDSVSLMLLISSLLVCFAASIFLLILCLRKSATPIALPPSPPSLPIIGHLHLLGDLPHQSFHNLSKLYGPLFSLYLGCIPAIVASSPDMAREILHTHDLAFASRPRNTVAKYAMFDSSDIAFSSYGAYWRLMRQICTTDLFSNKRLQAFTPVRTQEVAFLLQSILQDSNNEKEIPIRSRLLSVTNNIISRMTLGKRFSELAASTYEAGSRDLVSLLSELMCLLGAFNIGDFIPGLQWMDLQGYIRRSKSVGKQFKAMFKEIIDARRKQRTTDSSSASRDLLDVLLSASEDDNQEVPIKDDNIKGVLLDMFAAGTDTSANTAEWALAELVKNPAIMKKVEDELDHAVGKERLVQESDLPQLPYLSATVKETLRLHPVAPLLVPHESLTPCSIAGYHIPAKTRTFINTWSIGRNLDAWENPLEFRPERFLESNIDARGQHFHYLPFGSGRRGCPGFSLGLLSVQFMLAGLVQGFQWSLPESKREVDMSEKFGLTLTMANPLLVMAKPKLPHHLFASTYESCGGHCLAACTH